MEFKEIYEVDVDGFIVNNYVGYVKDGTVVSYFDEVGIVDKIEKEFITKEIYGRFHRAKWSNGEWIEGESQEAKEERESQELLESMKPLPEDLLDSDLEIKIITLLMEMEVI